MTDIAITISGLHPARFGGIHPNRFFAHYVKSSFRTLHDRLVMQGIRRADEHEVYPILPDRLSPVCGKTFRAVLGRHSLEQVEPISASSDAFSNFLPVRHTYKSGGSQYGDSEFHSGTMLLIFS